MYTKWIFAWPPYRVFNQTIAITGIALLLTLPGACTSLGSHSQESLAQQDFGPRQTIRVCVYRNADITDTQAHRIITAVDAEFDRYSLDLAVPWIRVWRRFNDPAVTVIDELTPLPLEPPCDRVRGLDSRHAGKASCLVVMQENLGAVETVTHTRGYILYTAALSDKVSDGPNSVAIHEAYHLLGCEHDSDMTACYQQIAALKQAASSEKRTGDNFFPGVSISREPITSRAEVDRLLRQARESRE
jgi:hypothetical protein